MGGLILPNCAEENSNVNFTAFVHKEKGSRNHNPSNVELVLFESAGATSVRK
jgi:hypothetical protein